MHHTLGRVYRRGGMLLREAAWRIGSDMSVQVWGDNWLPTKHSPRIISPMFSGGEDTKVGDFIDQVQKTWKEDLIDEVFYGFEASIIKKHSPVLLHSR